MICALFDWKGVTNCADTLEFWFREQLGFKKYNEWAKVDASYSFNQTVILTFLWRVWPRFCTKTVPPGYFWKLSRWSDFLIQIVWVMLMKLHVIFDPPRHPRKCLKVATVKVLRRTFWLLAGKIMRKWSATPPDLNWFELLIQKYLSTCGLPLLAECKDPSSGSDLLPPGSWQVQIGRRQESSLQSAIRSLVAGYKWFSKFLVNSVVGLNQP